MPSASASSKVQQSEPSLGEAQPPRFFIWIYCCAVTKKCRLKQCPEAHCASKCPGVPQHGCAGCGWLLSPCRDIYGSLAIGVLSADTNGARKPLSSKSKISATYSNGGRLVISNAHIRVCDFPPTPLSLHFGSDAGRYN